MIQRLYTNYRTSSYEITQNNIIDRHFLYNQLIDYYYGLRDKEEDALTICKKFCIESIAHTSNFLKEDEKQHNRLYKDSREKRDYIAPRIPAFQRLAIIYENENEFDKAVEVCQKALDLNLKDGTKGGFEGRIKRLERKKEKQG